MNIRVMLVDTRPERQAVLRPALSGEGIDVVACVTPDQDLLSSVLRHMPDVVLIDVDCPCRDTMESLRRVQASHPRPMVLFTQDDKGESIRPGLRRAAGRRRLFLLIWGATTAARIETSLGQLPGQARVWEQNPNTHRAQIMALLEAGRWMDAHKNRWIPSHAVTIRRGRFVSHA